MPLPSQTNSATSRPAASYRALSPLTVTSVVLGVLSLSTAIAQGWTTWLLLTIIPLAGSIFGWRSLKQIRKAPDEWTGLELAWAGIGLSAGLWLLGSCFVVVRYSGFFTVFGISEVPYGYQVVSYEMLQPDPSAPTMPIPQSALDMQDKKIYLKGYMQSRRQLTGIKEFILCPTNGQCQFCTPNPKRTEMIRVVLQGDLETCYTTNLIGVAGRFRVNTDDPLGIVYGLDADYIR
jgi:hypothetical protein